MSRRNFLKTVGAAGAALALDSPSVDARPLPVSLAARPLPLKDVRLTGGPLKHAQDLDIAYLLQLEPDRMMAFFRIRAGLEPKGKPYGGWDGDHKNLTGHIAGHYLSAVSLMYAATGDKRFKQRAHYLVAEMAEVQSKYEDGYLGALENGHEKFAAIREGHVRGSSFDLNGLWSPWYVQHKIFAGLRDAHRHTGCGQALEVSKRFAGWVESVVGGLTEEQDQQMLATEFGGMNEVLMDLAYDAGDSRWYKLSHRFYHHAVMDPLSRKEDILGGLHGNTQVPKMLGSVEPFIVPEMNPASEAVSYFWNIVVAHHSFATGGHGTDEYFGPPDKLSSRVDGRTDESCNVYNMLKLTRRLFSLDPDTKYAEFHERALFNHVLGSIDPSNGATCYMVPVGRGVQREYQNMLEDFTCCVGTGMENHALHGDGIYYESGDRLWVNIYAPSTAYWKSAGVRIAMETGFPEGETATLTFTPRKPRKFVLELRRPAWAGDGFTVSVNSSPVDNLPAPGNYIELDRIWHAGDTVAVTLPKSLRTEPLPDNPHRVALMWGPLVLAGDLGEEDDGNPAHPHAPEIPAGDRPISQWLHPVEGQPGHFRASVAYPGKPPQDVDFVPFYRLHRRKYAAYWDLVSEITRIG
jgi:DUF1680 family protein